MDQTKIRILLVIYISNLNNISFEIEVFPFTIKAARASMIGYQI